MPGLVAKGTGHTAASGSDRFDLETGNQPQRLSYGRHCSECLLVAMAMHQYLGSDSLQWQLEPAGIRLASEEFFEQIRALRQSLCCHTGHQRLEFVAQGQQTRRFK